MVVSAFVACSKSVPAANPPIADDFVPLNTQPGDESPLPPQEAIKHLRVPDGFQLTLAAAEPDVQQPIAIAFDDRGRLWVAESYSYDGSTFTDETHDRILIFEDTTGDGVLDSRRVFCDGLTHLTGLELGFGGVWITAPPNLAWIPDRDGDDVPDGEPVIHLDGWSLKAEHNSVNGLTWGPDGWLYGRHGIKHPSFVGRPDAPEDERIELSCCIWRYHPTQHVFEIVADGTINPWGLDFDDHGQGFLTTSVVDHLWHLVPGAHYERWKGRGVHPEPSVYEAMTSTNDHLHWGSGSPVRSEKGAGGPTAPTDHAAHEAILDFGGGHSHCDAMIYLGDSWPETYRGSLLTSNIHGRRVNCDRLEQMVGEYAVGEYRGVHDDDFLVSSDPWFRAVSMEYGPDGDVYLTDWSDNGECHDRDGVHRTSGRIYKISWGAPAHVRVDLANASTEQLVEYQLHRNDWYVRHARRLLQERAAVGESLSAAHARLRSLFDQHPDVTRKLRAMWALHATGGIDTSWLVHQLRHPNAHVRSWSVRLLSDHGEPAEEAMAGFLTLAETESSWLVQMSLASALQKVSLGSRWPIAACLATSTASTSSPNLQRMLWYAMEAEVARNPQRSLVIVTDVSPRLRRWIARRIAEASPEAVAPLVDSIDRTQDPEKIVDLLNGFNDALFVMATERLPISTAALVGKLIQHQNAHVRIAAMMTAAAVGDQATLQEVRAILHDSDVDPATRQAALAGLVRRKPLGFAEDLQRLLNDGEMVSAALPAAAVVNDPRLHATILDTYAHLSARNRVAAIDALVARPSSAKLLVSAIEQGHVTATAVSASQARQVIALKDHDLTKRFEQVWGSARPSSADRLQIIKAYKRALDPSRIVRTDLANGRKLFQTHCANCHRLFGEGQTLGPDLTGANRHDLDYLLTNVVDPSAVVPVDFRLTNVLTEDGRVISGTISQQSSSLMVIQTATESIQVQKDEVPSGQVTSTSIMPEGLLEKLSESQVQDLFAWLMSEGPPLFEK